MKFRRKNKLDDWNPARSDAALRRARRFGTVTHWFTVILNVAIAGFNAYVGQWWVVGFSMTLVVVLLRARTFALKIGNAHDKRRAESDARLKEEADRLGLDAQWVPFGEGSLDLEVAELLPGISQATSVVMTMIVGRALSEGWTIDRIIETSNMPGDAIRHYARQAERGL